MGAPNMTPEQWAAYQQFLATQGQQPQVAPVQQPVPQQPQFAPPGVDPSQLSGQLNQMMQGAAPPSGMPQGGGGSNLSRYNVGGIATRNFELLPTKVPIEFRITKADEKRRDDGITQIKVELLSVWPQEAAGVTVMDTVTLTDDALWKFKSLIVATGLCTADGSQFTGQSAQDFVGKIVRAMVKHSEWNEDTRNKINGGFSMARDFAAAQQQHVAQPAPQTFPQYQQPQQVPQPGYAQVTGIQPGALPQAPPAVMATVPPVPGAYVQQPQQQFSPPPPPPGAVQFAPPAPPQGAIVSTPSSTDVPPPPAVPNLG